MGSVALADYRARGETDRVINSRSASSTPAGYRFPREVMAVAVRWYLRYVVEADHGRLKARLRPMRGLKAITSLRTVATGHAFVQNLRRGHYELTTDIPVHDRLRIAFAELARCV